tara:strand:- start:892 stop:1185 length:294 start_codon:yes stop_codon:yes gene_type:complete
MTIDQKIPSPSEIKNSSVKFTPQEIEELNSFQKTMNTLVFRLGQIQVTKIQIKEQETILKEALKKQQQEEKKLADKLSKKYGQGSLDIETGTFTPTK